MIVLVEIDFVSPGLGLSSSMSSNTSRQQIISCFMMKDLMELRQLALTVTNLTLNGGTIYDWEIADFSAGTAKGTKYDVLNYNSIDFESGQKIGINILAIQNSNGAAGGFNNFSNVSNSYSGNQWFSFLAKYIR